jgi:hypothetical protein
VSLLCCLCVDNKYACVGLMCSMCVGSMYVSVELYGYDLLPVTDNVCESVCLSLAQSI